MKKRITPEQQAMLDTMALTVQKTRPSNMGGFMIDLLLCRNGEGLTIHSSDLESIASITDAVITKSIMLGVQAEHSRMKSEFQDFIDTI